MSYIGRLVFKTTGVMSNRALVKNSNKIGTAIADKMLQNKGKMDMSEAKQIVADTVGKKAADKIKFFSNKSDVIKYVFKQGILSKDDLRAAFEAADAFSASSRYSRNACIFIDKNEIRNAQGVNLLTHEIQHALSSTCGKQSLYLLKGKFSQGRKLIDKSIQKFKQYDIQNKYIKLQNEAYDLLVSDKPITPKAIQELIYSKGILVKGENKKNIYILKQLKKAFKDEVRSYSVGSEAENAYLGVRILNFEEITELFENLMIASAREARQIRINQIKSFFGIKVKN